MDLLILISNRILKISGVFTKTIGYVFHFIFPNKRFTIPKNSKPLKVNNKDSKIPKILWQTNFTNKVTLPVYINYLFNRLMSMDYEYRFLNHEDRDIQLKKYATQEQFDIYSKIKDGAAQADFWRMFVLNKFGGVYMDIDGHFVCPISYIVPNDISEMFIVPRRGKYSNYFIASAPDNKILQKTLEIIINNIKNFDLLSDEEKSIYKITGPIALENAIGDDKVNCRIYKLTCAQGSFTNEHFQYIDKKNGKWIHTSKDDILIG